MHEALKMSPAQRGQRAVEKKAALLGFLCSGEQWTTLPVVAELLKCSERNALRLLQKLVAEKLLKVDDSIMKFTRQKLYGVSDHGIAVVGFEVNMKAFGIGRTNPSYVAHHIESQLIRIRAEQAGWTAWVPGKALMVSNAQRLKKLPDSLATRPDGRRAAIEIDRYVKSTKRLTDIVGAHLSQIVDKHYDVVYYFTPYAEAKTRAFSKIDFVVVGNQKIKLNDSHRSRFKVFDLANWKGEM